MLNGQPIFVAENNESMLTEIIKKIGAPDKGLVKQLNPEFTQKLP
jgi:hypothetical protein